MGRGWQDQEQQGEPDPPGCARGAVPQRGARILLLEARGRRGMTDRSTAATVAIIGAGIGGCYLAAELGIAGFKLRLHDIDDSRLSEIRARGGVDVEGERDGFAVVDRATTDLGSALDGADVIIIVTGGNAQAMVARSLAPLLRDGQVILLIQGNTGGSLIVRRALDAPGW